MSVLKKRTQILIREGPARWVRLTEVLRFIEGTLAMLVSEIGTCAAEVHIGSVQRWFAGTKSPECGEGRTEL